MLTQPLPRCHYLMVAAFFAAPVALIPLLSRSKDHLSGTANKILLLEEFRNDPVDTLLPEDVNRQLQPVTLPKCAKV